MGMMRPPNDMWRMRFRSVRSKQQPAAEEMKQSGDQAAASLKVATH